MASLEVETLLLIAGMAIGTGVMIISLVIPDVPWQGFFIGAAFFPLYRRFAGRYITSLNVVEMENILGEESDGG